MGIFLGVAQTHSVNSLDDLGFHVTRRRSILGGWVTIMALLLAISAAVHLTLLYNDPRSSFLAPYTEVYKAHEVFKETPQQISMNFGVLFANCSFNRFWRGVLFDFHEK